MEEFFFVFLEGEGWGFWSRGGFFCAADFWEGAVVFGIEVVGGDFFAVVHDDEVFAEVAEFADVAGPGVVLEELVGVWGEGGR